MPFEYVEPIIEDVIEGSIENNGDGETATFVSGGTDAIFKVLLSGGVAEYFDMSDASGGDPEDVRQRGIELENQSYGGLYIYLEENGREITNIIAER